MAVLKNKDNTELHVDCNCGCGDGIRIKIDMDTREPDCCAFITYVNGNFYRDQNGMFSVLRKKLKKIWAIIRDKDYYYSDIIMSIDDFNEFKKYINSL